MPRKFSLRIHKIVPVLVFLICMGASAEAYNLPGSSGAAVHETSEEATGMVVRSLRDSVEKMRNESGGAVLSTSGSNAALAFAATGAGGTPLGFAGELRDIDNDRLDGSIFVGSVLLGYEMQPGVMLFGGLIAEHVDVDTLYDNGTVEGDGLGAVAGIDYQVSDRFFLTGILGAMRLDYDVTRLGGGIRGNFDSDRYFIDLGGEYHTRAGAADLRLDFGLLYYSQDNDSYTESGGAVVAASTHDQLSATAAIRSTWGVAGQYRPFFDLSGRRKLSGSAGLPAGLVAFSDTDWDARLAIGVERNIRGSALDAQIGANFADDGFDGLDARLMYTFRF